MLSSFIAFLSRARNLLPVRWLATFVLLGVVATAGCGSGSPKSQTNEAVGRSTPSPASDQTDEGLYSLCQQAKELSALANQPTTSSGEVIKATAELLRDPYLGSHLDSSARIAEILEGFQSDLDLARLADELVGDEGRLNATAEVQDFVEINCHTTLPALDFEQAAQDQARGVTLEEQFAQRNPDPTGFCEIAQRHYDENGIVGVNAWVAFVDDVQTDLDFELDDERGALEQAVHGYSLLSDPSYNQRLESAQELDDLYDALDEIMLDDDALATMNAFRRYVSATCGLDFPYADQ